MLPHDIAVATFHAVMSSARSGDGLRGMPARVFDDLDWPLVCEAIAARCIGRDAAELAADLGLLPSPETAVRRLAEVDTAGAAWARGASPPLRGVDALGDAVLRARKADVLRGEELLRVGRGADAAGKCAAWARTASGCEPIVEHLRRLADVRDVAAELQRCIDVSGEVLDAASPDLGRLRHRAQRMRESIIARLERIVRSPRFEGILQDDYVTIRDDRYVLPVRAGERGDFPGIVHGQSASGQTLFIEPQELIAPNNDLRLAQLDVDNEVRRILTRLTALVRSRADDIEANHDILTYVDLTFAAGRLAAELRCHVPTVERGGRISLRAARHPVLAIRALTEPLAVIPNDIEVDCPALVVSGPNTGGKTITLKTVGLCALLARAGIPLPTAVDSAVPFYEAVFSDIGDNQGVARDLSTFSGHVANIASFLPACGRGSLVLLDELFAGTDPEQGAALGRALVSTLVDRGAHVVVTTHLESLKTLGAVDERFATASVAFDIERMRPSYRLRAGVPGASYALRIASRLGLDASIITHAEALLGGTVSADREAIIARLEQQLTVLDDEREQTVALNAQLRRQAAASEEALQRQRRAEREILDVEMRKLADEIRALRGRAQEAAAAIRAMDAPTTPEEARALAAAVDAARRVGAEAERALAARSRTDDAATPLVAAPRVGDSVWMRAVRQDATVLAVEGDRITVQAGAIRSTVSLDALARSAPESVPARVRPTSSPRVTLDIERGAATRLDVRGERVDDAVEQLGAFLERASRTSAPWLVVVHGHGTGALKRAVRRYLDDLGARVSWRPGEQGEGGDGVTVVVIAE